MIIGFDFDNTIVCYDKAIGVLAEQRFSLPSNVPRNKIGIRDYLKANGQEEAWTRFQGELYGPGMAYADPFSGSLDVIQELAANGHTLAIISHRTRFPYLGEPYDLHEYARTWILERIPSVFVSVTFHERKADKIEMIARTHCGVFLDDLPEILSDQAFPTSTLGVLFSPDGGSDLWNGLRVTSWRNLTAVVQAGVEERD
jgi:hypothetical protein